MRIYRQIADYETVVQLIVATKNFKGLIIKYIFDEAEYLKGVKINENKINAVNIKQHKFHGEWNYVIRPNET